MDGFISEFYEIRTDENDSSMDPPLRPQGKVSLETTGAQDPLDCDTSHSHKERVFRSHSSKILELKRRSQSNRPVFESSTRLGRLRRNRRSTTEEDGDIVSRELERLTHETNQSGSNVTSRISRRTAGIYARYFCTNRVCKRSYTNYDAFYKHTKYECGKRPRFKCGYCGYQSLRAGNVRAHSVHIHPGSEYLILDTYHNDRPYTIRRLNIGAPSSTQ